MTTTSEYRRQILRLVGSDREPDRVTRLHKDELHLAYRLLTGESLREEPVNGIRVQLANHVGGDRDPYDTAKLRKPELRELRDRLLAERGYESYRSFLRESDLASEIPSDAEVKVTERTLGAGQSGQSERTVYLAAGETFEHRWDGPSMIEVEVLPDDE